MRIRHLGIVTDDLERSAEFYEKVFGFKRLGPIRTPGHYPGKAIDLSDGEVNYSLLCPDERVETSHVDAGHPRAPTTSASRSRTPRAPPRRSRATASRSTARTRSSGRRGSSSSRTSTESRSTSPPPTAAGSTDAREKRDLVAGANPEPDGHRSGHKCFQVFLGMLRIGATAFGGGSATIVAMRQLSLRKAGSPRRSSSRRWC